VHSTIEESQQNITSKFDLEDKIYNCKDCYKKYKSKKFATDHMLKCKKIQSKYECEGCHLICSSRQSLARHKDNICKSINILPLVNNDSSSSTTAAIGGASINVEGNHNTLTANTTNIVNILTFPEDKSSNFDFVCDKITKEVMKRIISNSPNAAVGFKRFISEVLEKHPENRCITKINPNVAYSKVHTNDGNWDLISDKEAYPIFTHHMTTAAMGKLIEFKKDLRKLFEKLKNFEGFITDINENDESVNYEDTIYAIKLLIINISKKWELDL
jgi:uncharacterized protein YkvS